MKHLPAILLISFLLGCGSDKTDLKAEEQAILKCWADWEEKEKTGDPDLTAYYWADDAVVMVQGQSTITGKQNLKDMVSDMKNIPGLKMTWDKTPSRIEISRDGQMAWVLAKSEISITDRDGKVNRRINQAVQVWQKDSEGNWKASFVMMYPETVDQ